MPDSSFAGELLNQLADNTDIQRLINFAAKRIGEPVILCDTRFRILYMSAETNLAIELWNKARAEGYVSDAVLADIHLDKIVEKLKTSFTPVYSRLPNGYNCLRIALRNKGTYCGFAGIYDYHRPFEDKDSEMLITLGRALSTLTTGDAHFQADFGNEAESFLYQLLCCTTQEQSRNVCRRFQSLTRYGEKRLVSISSPEIPAIRLHDTLQVLWRKVTMAVYEDRLFLLLENHSLSLYPSAMEKLCHERNLSVVVSDIFYSHDDLPTAYRQTKACPAKPGVLSEFGENYLVAVQGACLRAQPPEFYVHHMLKQLQKYDETYHLNYLNTLRIFLQHQGSLSDTADVLGVHYNTIKHRISVIEEVLAADLKNDYDLMQKLQISFMFLKSTS